MSQEHSAEWLRGGIDALENLAIAFETPALRLLALECRQRKGRLESVLAAAEAREAGEPSAELLGLRRALAIAKGCEDYGGGYQGEKYDAYHHGMQTVQRCIQAAIDGDTSLQLRVFEGIGAAACKDLARRTPAAVPNFPRKRGLREQVWAMRITPNNALDLEALERLHAASTPGNWVTTTGYAGAVRRKFLHRGNDTDGETFDRRNGIMDCADADVECTAALHNAFPALRDRIRELEGEVERLRQEVDHPLLVLVDGKPEALATRDARMKHEGAIEALEDIAKNAGIDGGKAYVAKVVYREFPDLLHQSVGVVEAADLMARAAKLREGK